MVTVRRTAPTCFSSSVGASFCTISRSGCVYIESYKADDKTCIVSEKLETFLRSDCDSVIVVATAAALVAAKRDLLVYKL